RGQFYRFKNYGEWVRSGGLGSMGFGIGSGIGGELGEREKRVVCFVGDGGFEMRKEEMGLVGEYGVKVKILLINNRTLPILKQSQHKFFNKPFSHSLFNHQPHFIKIPQPYPINPFFIHSPHKLQSSIHQPFPYHPPPLIQVTISPIQPLNPILPTPKSNHQMQGY
uniref:thiamine pyrophosphate-dependent enzyme n=1 Tax=Staphylococcus epidermidis TaxID=1282 RepID=UPI0021B2CE22